jgi:hypothetical protein
VLSFSSRERESIIVQVGAESISPIISSGQVVVFYVP